MAPRRACPAAAVHVCWRQAAPRKRGAALKAMANPSTKGSECWIGDFNAGGDFRAYAARPPGADQPVNDNGCASGRCQDSATAAPIDLSLAAMEKHIAKRPKNSHQTLAIPPPRPHPGDRGLLFSAQQNARSLETASAHGGVCMHCRRFGVRLQSLLATTPTPLPPASTRRHLDRRAGPVPISGRTGAAVAYFC
ncbi:hypothetical protein ON010_g15893 [Phytophthora cinnamomi]|nr:hypothetical protein ON010_g15893 [Phytophthora cinnamomi]